MENNSKMKHMMDHPHCVFCEHSKYELFKMCCKKYPKKPKLKAIGCESYTPTEEPIENRSPR